MTIFKTVRKVTKFDFDETAFLAFLKKEHPEDSMIQDAQEFQDLLNVWEIYEFEFDFDKFLTNGKLDDEHVGYYLDEDEAYSDMEFGIH